MCIIHACVKMVLAIGVVEENVTNAYLEANTMEGRSTLSPVLLNARIIRVSIRYLPLMV